MLGQEAEWGKPLLRSSSTDSCTTYEHESARPTVRITVRGQGKGPA